MHSFPRYFNILWSLFSFLNNTTLSYYLLYIPPLSLAPKLTISTLPSVKCLSSTIILSTNMLKPLVNSSTKIPSCLIHSSKPFLCGDGTPWMSLSPGHSQRRRISRRSTSTGSKSIGRINCVSDTTAGAVIAAERNKPVQVKAVVRVQGNIGGLFAHINRVKEDLADLFGKNLLLDLVSAELDPETGIEKKTIQAYADRTDREGDELEYQAYFSVPANFGEIGAVLVQNEENREMFIKEIVLTSSDDGGINHEIHCESWLHSKSQSPEKRVFFTSKSYLPSNTPNGLERLRKKELEAKRGDGTGERQNHERIYDYDYYNDLGDPDKDDDMARPVLGGNKQYPYPRRCRTGRARCKKDPQSESRADDNYIPRDENFSEVKQATFSAKTLRSALQALVPAIESVSIDTKLGFPYLTAIDSLYNEGIPLPKAEGFDLFRSFLPRLVKAITDSTEQILQFETPELMDRDKFAWFRDEEFARQTLAGINPYSIKLITEFPLVSKLDPKIYGPSDSLITGDLIEEEIKGVMTVERAILQKRLFIVDYHDLLLPYVHKVRKQEGTTLYGSRTVFFLTKRGTLRPIAVELTRPASPTQPHWRQVFTPCWDSTNAWLWKLAKAHALANDSGIHQLYVHWLRTHCATEPYIIASNRQLSELHPVYRLLHPHFRYTMEINQLARVFLINGGGIIENNFSPGKYSAELSSVAYGKLWRFDTEALPADLIARGMAEEDPTAEHGVSLVIEDYPYANDGLLIWDAIKQWVTDYVNHYYPDDKLVQDDVELQAWWTEIRTIGHGDKKDEPWWLKLDSKKNLIHIVNTIIWVAAGHHAAVNFGQYHYSGYFPNRPTIARRPMPVEEGVDKEEFEKFLKKPESALMRLFPTQLQASIVMVVLDILSGHSPDEEYIGENPELPWKKDPVINAAFERFSGRLKEIEGIIDGRNVNPDLKNRCGAGIVPYELLKPYSKPGVTGMGIPNSISI